MAKKAALFLMLITLAGCGPSFVKKDLGPEVANAKRYGIMFTKIVYNGSNIPADPRIPFLTVMAKTASDELGQSGLETVLIPENGDFAPAAVKFTEFSKKGGLRSELNPENDFGDMRELFKKANIDILLISSSNSWGQNPSFAAAFGAASMDIALKATLGGTMGGGSPVTSNEILAISPDGKVFYADWKPFAGGLLANKGAITRLESAKKMEATLIDRYIGAIVKK